MNEAPRTVFEISNGTIIRVVLFILLFWVLYYMRSLVLVIVTAVVLASAIEPMVALLQRRRVGRVAAVTIIYLVTAIAIMGFFYFFLPPLLNDFIGFASKFEDQFKALNFFELEPTEEFAATIKGFDIGSLQTTLQQTREALGGVSGGVLNFTSAVFGGALSFVLIVVLSFYFAVQETGIDDFLRVVTPTRKQDYVLSLWKRSQAKIGLWMQGQMLLGLLVAVLVYLGLMILSVPYAFFLAILAGVFELIPIFGPIIAAVPAVILAFSDGGATVGLMTIGLFLIIQQFENHLIYPLVVRKVVGVHPIMVIIALLAGAKLAGFLGIILSVPLAAALKEYIDDVQKKKEKEHRAVMPQ